jgi:hypothetical protein
MNKKKTFTLSEAIMILKLKDGTQVEGTPTDLAAFAKAVGLVQTPNQKVELIARFDERGVPQYVVSGDEKPS